MQETVHGRNQGLKLLTIIGHSGGPENPIQFGITLTVVQRKSVEVLLGQIVIRFRVFRTSSDGLAIGV